MPLAEELSAYYSSFYRLDYQFAGEGPSPRHISRRTVEAELRAKNLRSILRPGARTLDIGCGSGEFVTCMQREGHEAYGVEPGSGYGSHARMLHGDRVRVESWEDISWGGSFDLVSCFHVLEHLRSPMQALHRFAELTHPGGLVYVEVPNLGSMDSIKGFGALHFAHVVGFNHHNLVYAAAQCGLRPRVIVSPTGIIFEHGGGVDLAEQLDRGRAISDELYSGYRPYQSYLWYQLGRPWRNRRARKQVVDG
jgi:SAM-dependent methyltransferase